MINQNEMKDPNAILQTENKKPKVNKIQNLYQDREEIAVSIFIPKEMLSDIETLILISDKPMDIIFTDFIVVELEIMQQDPYNSLECLLEKFGFFKKIRHYFDLKKGNLNHKVEQKDVLDLQLVKFDIIIRIPKIYLNYVDIICRITNENRRTIFNHFFIGHLEYVLSNPEIFLGYLENYTNFFDRFRKGINLFQNNTRLEKILIV